MRNYRHICGFANRRYLLEAGGYHRMVNIGAVMEYGATIKHQGGATIIIPPRPFLHPVMEKYRDQIIRNYRR